MRLKKLKDVKYITLCLWVYVAANMSKASVVSFGKWFKIHYQNPKQFIANFYGWKRYCTVLFGLFIFLGLP